jgi:threonine dehydrogenase-like Zn-dependent dehydrogenase
MKAGQIVAWRQANVIDVPEPSLADAPPGQIKVRVERACLCGSDIPWFAHDHHDYPLPVGESIHECLGTIVESTSPHFQEGDFVMALPHNHGALCEYFVTEEDQAIHMPRDAIALDELLITQPLGTVIWACQKLGNMLDLDVAILGQGAIGLLFTHLLSNMGARRVIAMDKLDYRLAAARRMRATHTVNVDRQDPEAAVREITGGKMADVVVEAVGHQLDAINTCVELARHRGTVIAFGVPDEPLHPSFPYKRLFFQNLTLIGSVGANVASNYSLARDMILQGRIDVSPLVTHVLPFAEMQRAYELFVDHQDGAIKVVLDYTGN